MNIIHKLIGIGLLAGLAAGCSSGGEEEPVVPVQPERIPITLRCGISAPTRVTDTAFETGDRIGLYVVNNDGASAGTLLPSGNHADNVAFSYDGKWTPATPLYWQDETTPADFYAYHPYTSAIGNPLAYSFEVKADQSTEAAYKSCDFLWGKAVQAKPTDDAVSITLGHLLSCAVVQVKAGSGFTDEELAAADVQVSLNGVTRQATINLSNGELTPGNTADSITLLRQAGNTFKALVVPQTVAQADDFITLAIDGEEFRMPRGFTFASGKRHTFTVTVRKLSSGINIDISGWEDDGTDHGGVAE